MEGSSSDLLAVAQALAGSGQQLAPEPEQQPQEAQQAQQAEQQSPGALPAAAAAAAAAVAEEAAPGAGDEEPGVRAALLALLNVLAKGGR